ncbi:MAG: AAA family ATPase [Bacteroidales bacterium]|nr:AAA family ATPase [Bacteroidales bacterium]
MEISRFKSLLSELNVGSPLHYHTGRNNFIITELDIEHDKITVEREAETSSVLNINFQKLLSLGQKFEINKPIDTEVFFGSSGNDRSVLSGLAANTSEIYSVKIKGRTNIVWCPHKPHSPNQIVLLTENDFQQISGIKNNVSVNSVVPNYRKYITAIRTKPFLLLAGISGTGKSRIVRELARACWGKDHEESKAHKPRNYEIVQVKPNWHDSTELIGYVSRSSGTPVFVVGDFLKFVVKAWEEPDVPYFLCLDEMNLAPVEQYFAEFLSVIESRKLYPDGKIETDPILKPDFEGINVEDGTPILSKWYENLIGQLLSECPAEKLFALKDQFEIAGISIPQNLIVIGTVNMDETTFSFSRKVLDRAMTIEMNEVDLYGGLAEKHETIGKIEFKTVVGDAVEGVDVYETNKDVCDIVIEYLKTVNDKLEGTPFKIAYRTRNEFLLYVVNNLPYNKDDNNEELSQEDIINRALDEITCMKILPRIEGDVDKTSGVLNGLEDVLKGRFNEQDSASLKKIKEMKNRLQSGFTSFWS